MAVSAYSFGEKELVTVKKITSEKAVCLTTYRATIEISWNYGIPAPSPKVGDVWLVEKIGPYLWNFSSKVDFGEKQRSRHLMMVDPIDVIGKERRIVFDLRKFGFDGVVVKVADKGVIYWQSEIAEKYDLVYAGHDISVFVQAAKALDMSVSLLIGSRLWCNTQSEATYAQRKIGDSASSAVYSPLAAVQPLAEICNDLYKTFSYATSNIVLEYGAYGMDYDFSYTNLNVYLDINGIAVDEDALLAQDRKAIFAWRNFTNNIPRLFVSELKAQCSGVAFSLLAVGEYPRPYKGISQAKSNSVFIKASNRAYDLALASKCGSSVCIPVNANINIKQLGEYGLTEILFDDFKGWNNLSQKAKQSLAESVRECALQNVSKNDSIAVFIPDFELSDSEQLEIKEICDLIYCNSFTPKIIFESAPDFSGISNVIIPYCKSLSDTAVSSILALLDRQDVGVILLGDNGVIDAEGDERKNPFISYFVEADVSAIGDDFVDINGAVNIDLDTVKLVYFAESAHIKKSKCASSASVCDEYLAIYKKGNNILAFVDSGGFVSDFIFDFISYRCAGD